jgi:hypothetical protein
MTDKNIKLLDLDKIPAGQPEVVVKLNGKEHRLKPMTVDGFIQNMKLVQGMKNEGNFEEEIEVVKDMILILFPTMTREDLGTMTFPQLEALKNFAQEASGSNEAEAGAAEAASENPPTAGE